MFFFFQAEDGIRDLVRSRGLGDVYKRQLQMAKDSILKSFDTTVEGGLEYERKAFYLLFASDDMKEGMKAFIEKRKPEWKGE